ncbi:hypothetical protein QJS66_11930 [Kocuria rhizophila]|nr:hypothetical protein QJS66_11930 [Kocuria rhizophila]
MDLSRGAVPPGPRSRRGASSRWWAASWRTHRVAHEPGGRHGHPGPVACRGPRPRGRWAQATPLLHVPHDITRETELQPDVRSGWRSRTRRWRGRRAGARRRRGLEGDGRGPGDRHPHPRGPGPPTPPTRRPIRERTAAVSPEDRRRLGGRTPGGAAGAG